MSLFILYLDRGSQRFDAHWNYLEFLKVFRQSNGWMRESDARNGVSSEECDVPTPEFFSFRKMSHKTYLREVLDSFAAMVEIIARRDGK